MTSLVVARPPSTDIEAQNCSYCKTSNISVGGVLFVSIALFILGLIVADTSGKNRAQAIVGFVLISPLVLEGLIATGLLIMALATLTFQCLTNCRQHGVSGFCADIPLPPLTYSTELPQQTRSPVFTDNSYRNAQYRLASQTYADNFRQRTQTWTNNQQTIYNHNHHKY